MTVVCKCLVCTVLLASRAEAYVGPGAGFALAGSFWTALVLVVALLSVFLLPLRMTLKWWRRRRAQSRAKARRVVVVGLDGFDPKLARRFMAEGGLPHLTRLAEEGTFCDLQTTLPALTPSAWSTFATGVDASRHNIYDFITRHRGNYQPLLSSARLGPARRHVQIGPYRFPLGKPRIENLRKSQPFWKSLGQQGIFSSIIRVPITFPAEKFNGLLLAGMCVPDLRGTQGEFTLFTSDRERANISQGQVFVVEVAGNRVQAQLPGPSNPIRGGGGALAVDVKLLLDAAAGSAEMRAGAESVVLACGEYSPWIELKFDAGAGVKVRGICRFYLLSCAPFNLYVTPVQIDPEHPALPLSYPASFAVYLAKRFGKYGSLGLLEDTDSLNAEVLDEVAFLTQAYDLHEEREQMLFHELHRNKDGLVVCVFDGPDRIQHLFFRTLETDHPANRGRATEEFAGVIPDLYAKMDALVGRVVAELADDPEAVLWVVSDHGFCQFKRGVNLNSWLHQNGYLHLKEGTSLGGDWHADVDWSRTRAFALGLSGFYINRKGREGQGIVAEGEELAQLKAELVDKLSGLIDTETGEVAINKVWDTDTVFSGPYKDDAPDLLVGYNAGYRIAWSGANGGVTDWVFEDNTKSWSGDHCVDPRLVPGVLFCNRKIAAGKPALGDLPPTIMALFGADRPTYMKGQDLFAAPGPAIKSVR